jgi:hypothetical protein
MQDEFIDHLNYMADNFTADQLNQAFKRDDITENNKSEFQQKLRSRVAQVKELKANFDEVNDTIINPISIGDLKKTDKNYFNKMMEYHAYENLRRELVLAKGTIQDKASRMKDLMNKMNSNAQMSSTDLFSLVDTNALDIQLQTLEEDVNLNKDLKKGEQTTANYNSTVKKYEALKKYKQLLTEFTAAQESSDPNIKVNLDELYDNLFEAYNDFATESVDYTKLGLSQYGKVNGTAQRVINKKTFDDLFDYIILGHETTKYNSLVNTLLDPEAKSKYIASNIAMQEKFEANKKEHIFELLKSYEDRKEASAMLIILHEKGIFFNLDEIDALIKDGIMPSELYDVVTNTPASKEKQQIAQDIIGKFYKNLTGKTIKTKQQYRKQGFKYESDKRTVAQILKQFGIKTGDVIDLSNEKELKSLLYKITKSKFLTPVDKDVLLALLNGPIENAQGLDIKIKVVDNAELPISIDTDGTVLIDVRYSGTEYKYGNLTFENLIVSAITQKKIADSISSNTELKDNVTNIMQQAKQQFKKLYPKFDVENEPLFNDINLFLSEALNNSVFQSQLNEMVNTIEPTQKSLWRSLYAAIKSSLNSLIKKKSLLNEALQLSTTAIKPEAVANIIQPAISEPVAQVEEPISEQVDDSNIATPTDSVVPLWKQKENLNQSIAEKNSQINVLSENLTKLEGLFSFRKRSAINKQLTKLIWELEDLENQLNDIQGQFGVSRDGDNLNVIATQIIPEVIEYDIDGNILINNNTPFKHLPKEVKQSLAALYGKEVNELSDVDKNEIQILLLTKYDYQKAVYDYVNEVDDYYNELAKQNAELVKQGKQQVSANFAEYKKQKSQVNKGKKTKQQISTREDLQKIVKDIVDLSIFTNAEIDEMLIKLKDKSALIPFTIQDIIQLASNKKIKLNEKTELEFLIELNKEKAAVLLAKQEERRVAAEKSRRDKKTRRAIDRINRVELLKLLRIEDENIKFNRALLFSRALNIGKKNWRHLITYNSSKFRLDETAFRREMKFIKRSISATVNAYKDFEFKTSDIKTELINEIKKLDKAGLLYPGVVYQINQALYKLNYPLLVRMLPTTASIKKAGFEPLTYNYDFINRKSLKAPLKLGITDYQKKLKALQLNYEGAADELTVMVEIINTIKNNKKYQELKSKRYDGVTDPIFEDLRGSDFGEGMFPSDYRFDSVLGDIYNTYDTFNDLVDAAYSLAFEKQMSLEDFEEQNRIAFAEAKLKEEEDAENERILFNNSETGQQILKDYNDNLEKYYASKAFDISNGLFTGNVEDLSEVEQDLYDKAYEEDLYEEELIPYEQLETVVPVEVKTTENKQNSLIDDYVELLYKESSDFNSLSDFLKSIYTNATTTYTNDIVYHFAMLKYVKSLKDQTSSKEKALLVNLIKNNISNNLYDNQYVILNGQLNLIESSEGTELDVYNLETNQSYKVPTNDFIDSFENLIEQNAEYKKLNINSVVSNKEIDYIKEAYFNIFNNFTSYINSTSKLEDDELKNQIIDKFKTCT